MKVDLALEKSCLNNHYIVINEGFYIRVGEDIWRELAEFLGIKVKGVKNEHELQM